MSGNPLAGHIARNVRRLRERQRIPYTELAERLASVGHPIPVLGLRRIEDMERRVTSDDLAALAAVLGVAHPWDLTADDDSCGSCGGTPPSGFRCLTCGRPGQRATEQSAASARKAGS